MPKQPKNSGKEWTSVDVKKLKELKKSNTPTPLIAWKIGRTEDAVRSKASEKGISLKPTNKPPYNRRKK